MSELIKLKATQKRLESELLYLKAQASEGPQAAYFLALSNYSFLQSKEIEAQLVSCSEPQIEHVCR